MKTSFQLLLCLWLTLPVGMARSAGTAQKPNPAQTSQTPTGQQDPDPCISDEQCSSLNESAISLSRAGQFEAALANYQKAYKLKPVPWLLVNIGRVHQKMGHSQEAITAYKSFLESPAARNDPELVTTAQQYLKQAEQDLARPKDAKVWLLKEERAPRPIWRVALGSGLVGLGIIGVGVGAYGMAIDGKCADVPVAPALECDMVYASRPLGLGLLIPGVLAIAGGAVTIALPGKKRMVRIQDPAAFGANSLAYAPR